MFAEGQRRYLESLNAYARQFVQPAARPDVDAVLGIPPTVAIEQRTSRGGAKSTVATATEIHHFLRLLFAKLGAQHCPDCDRPIESQTRTAVVASVMREFRGRTVELLAPLVVARKGYYTELARWAARKGYSHLRVDGEHLPTGEWPRLDRYREHDIDLPVAVLTVDPAGERTLRTALETALDLGRSLAIVAERGGEDADGAHPERRERRYSTARACAGCGRSFDELDPRLFSFNSRHGWCPRCRGTGLEPAASAPSPAPATGRTRRRRRKGARDRPPSEPRTVAEYERDEVPEGALSGSAVPCGACAGDRLRPEARAVRFRERTIGEVGRLSITEARSWVEDLVLDERDEAVAGDLLAELRSRLDFLLQVGLGYLSLHRAAPSLSGGEAQRIRLAAQLGSNLRGVCYVLDEPTIGLHARDNSLLLDALDRLRTHGNTVLVVEHDEATIRRAEHVIDLGPGAGAGGGEVVVAGSLARVMRDRRSVTGRWLSRPPPPMRSESPVRLAGTGTRDSEGREDGQAWLEVRNARRHNLKGISPRFPLGRLVCVTGVSGSGKSTLVREVLRGGLEDVLRNGGTGRGGRSSTADTTGGGAGAGAGTGAEAGTEAGTGGEPGCEAILGFEPVTRVLEVDQTPIGKTPRSCPVTYLKIWDHVRRLFAETTEARLRGWSASRFSFNTGEGAGGGRCPACGGQGERKVEMSFLPNARVPCEECEGARFTRETLGVRFRGRSIGDILDMTVEEAVEFFPAHPRVHHALVMLREVGLGYLRLGQQSPSLSGGEAQRLKLVTELAKARPSAAPRARRNHTVYLLDEPTVGLHMADVEKLVRVLHPARRGGAHRHRDRAQPRRRRRRGLDRRSRPRGRRRRRADRGRRHAGPDRRRGSARPHRPGARRVPANAGGGVNVLILDGYDEHRGALLADRLGPRWTVTAGRHSDPPETLASRLAVADAAVTQYWSAALPPAPRLRLLQLPGAGFDAIDFEAVPAPCAVCNVYEHEIGISEYIVAALLEREVRIARMDAALRRGEWRHGFVLGAPLHGELHGRTVGFLGYGRIAREAARRLAPFGVRIAARTRSPDPAGPGAELVSDLAGVDRLDDMLPEVDYLVVACPLTDATRGLVDARRLALLAPAAVVVNVSRGPIVDEDALYAACRDGTIGGAIIDTWYRYPDPTGGLAQRCLPSRHPFETLANVVMTPHASGWSAGLLDRRWSVIADNLLRLERSEPLHNQLRPPGGVLPSAGAP